MSWMDSWSRPSKSQSTPVPFYLLPGGEHTPYCHSCGRVIGARKTHAAASAGSEGPKYCSARCRGHRPGKLDREIEAMFVRALAGELEAGEDGGRGRGTAAKPSAGQRRGKKAKGDQRVLIACSTVEDAVFTGGRDADDGSARSDTPEPGIAHRDDSAVSSAAQPLDLPLEDVEAFSSFSAPITGYVDGDVLARMAIRSGTRVRPPQDVSEVNGSVGGEKGRAERLEENEEMQEKRRAGQRRAKEREMVKCAARRGVVFGFLVGDGNQQGEQGRRKCEAVMSGKVVEPSFAKGDWAIRWRE
ncbi:hypothetical protein JX265_007231 [Neoarthrinium moseri]|uniref:Uncharacterized protein n=1 Tax=Neoarthrinium moseri TaxID=1658444 RepID=A0A9P9WK36_9PEZI|nr:hypothetical protein JX266_003571 [Neoarthrinium moseri]KAI1867429.1 hypothetical protein JX265_007231 [Neoarthrinium moseri]